MASRRMVLAAAGGLAALALVALLVLPRGGGARAAAGQYLLPSPLPAPDFELTGQDGRPVRMRELGRGGLVVLFFGYTHCPDICPLTLADLSRARGMLGGDAGRVQVLFVTVDPARDTPAQLADYVRRFPGVTGLTGTAEALEKAAGDYLAFAERAPAAAGAAADAMPGMDDYLFDHTARSFVVQDRRIVMTFPPQTPAADIAAGLELLLER